MSKETSTEKEINGVDSEEADREGKGAILSTWSYMKLPIIAVLHTQTTRTVILKGKDDMDDERVFSFGMEMDWKLSCCIAQNCAGTLNY